MNPPKVLLIVDDDASALRALKRLVEVRQPSIRVLLAENGQEAVAHLQREPVAMVLTDLQMPLMNGFELIAWLTRNRPEVRCLPMTAHPESDTAARLADSPSMDYLLKPIDLDLLNHVLEEAFRPSVEGYVQGVGLPSFLQLVAMERKTCRLEVEGEVGIGIFCLADGQLVHASFGELSGNEAALEVLAWRDSRISVMTATQSASTTVTMPLDFLLMEAARLQDEREHVASRRVAEEESGFFRAFAGGQGAALPATESPVPAEQATARLDRRLEKMAEALGVSTLAVVDMELGVALAMYVKDANSQPGDRIMAASALADAESELAQSYADHLEGFQVTSTWMEEIALVLPGARALAVALVDRQGSASAMVRVQLAAAAGLLADDVHHLRRVRDGGA